MYDPTSPPPAGATDDELAQLEGLLNDAEAQARQADSDGLRLTALYWHTRAQAFSQALGVLAYDPDEQPGWVIRAAAHERRATELRDQLTAMERN